MKASEFVRIMQAAIEEHGDLEITVCDDGIQRGIDAELLQTYFVSRSQEPECDDLVFEI